MEKLAKQKKLIDKIKSKFCLYICKDPNYEYVSYNVQQHHEKKFNKRDEYDDDNLEILLTPKAKTDCRNRMPIYYKTPVNNNSIVVNLCDPNEDEDDDLESTTTLTTVTALDSSLQNIKSPNLTQFPFLIMSPEYKNNTTKVMLTPKKAQNNYYTPRSNDFNFQSMTASISSTDSSTGEEAHVKLNEYEYEKKLVFEIGSICSCYIPYTAKYDGDLTIKFAERLQVVGDNDQNYVLVKNLSSKSFGYVPRDSIVHVNDFLSYLI
jgi:hypothetical protein